MAGTGTEEAPRRVEAPVPIEGWDQIAPYSIIPDRLELWCYLPTSKSLSQSHLALRLVYAESNEAFKKNRFKIVWISLYPQKGNCCFSSSPKWRSEGNDMERKDNNRAAPEPYRLLTDGTLADLNLKHSQWVFHNELFQSGAEHNPDEINNPLDLDVNEILACHLGEKGSVFFNINASICCNPGNRATNCVSYILHLLDEGGLRDSAYSTSFNELGGGKHLMRLMSESIVIPISLFTIALYMIQKSREAESSMGPGGAMVGLVMNVVVIRLLELYFGRLRCLEPPLCKAIGQAFRSALNKQTTNSVILFLASMALAAPLLAERHWVDYELSDERVCATFMYDIAFLLAAFFSALLVAFIANAMSAYHDKDRLVTPESAFDAVSKLILERKNGVILPREVGHALQAKVFASIWPALIGYAVMELVRRSRSLSPWEFFGIIAWMITLVSVVFIGPLVVFPASRTIELSVQKRATDLDYRKRVRVLDRGMIRYQVNVLLSLLGMVGTLMWCHKAPYEAPPHVRLLTTTPGLILGYSLSEVPSLLMLSSSDFADVDFVDTWGCFAILGGLALPISAAILSGRHCPDDWRAGGVAFLNSLIIIMILSYATYPARSILKLRTILRKEKGFSPDQINSVAGTSMGRLGEGQGDGPLVPLLEGRGVVHDTDLDAAAQAYAGDGGAAGPAVSTVPSPPDGSEIACPKCDFKFFATSKAAASGGGFVVEVQPT